MTKKSKILFEILFLVIIYASGLYFRLLPRLEQDPHLLTFEADIWYRLTMAQNILDHGHITDHDIRYESYGYVPFWYPPLGLHALNGLAKISHQDLPTVASRIVPWIESLAPLSLYVFCRFLMGTGVAILATLFLALTPSFVFWTGICDVQSFVLFMTPLVLLLWIKHVEWRSSARSSCLAKWFRILILGGLLAVCFMTHLFYFLLLVYLALVTVALSFEKIAKFKLWIDLIFVIAISQLITIFWWYPTNLYWWWIKSIVTSCGNYAAGKKLSDYGIVAGIAGLYFFLLIVFRIFSGKKNPLKYGWVVFFWALVPLFETHNETILSLFKKDELAWSTVWKPLEGFRFYCFLAQPLAVGFGLMMMDSVRKLFNMGFSRKKVFSIIPIPLIFILMLIDIQINFGFSDRMKNAGFTMEEIRAGQWFREHSKPTDRIIADYYRAQMFGGFSGGRALLGMAFPLRNVTYPFISQNNYTVPMDVYRIYTTDNPEEAIALMKRYNATHLFVSENMGTNGNLIFYGFGIPYNFKTLQDERYFRAVYQEEGKAVILERIN